MKIINYIFLILFLFCSCDTSEDYFFNLDQEPKILINSCLTDNLTINLLDSNKIGHNYVFNYVTDSINDVFVNQTIGNDSICVISNKINIFSLSEGMNEFEIIAIDKFNKSNKAFLSLYNFKNLNPVAKLEVTQLSQFDEFQILVSANDSYDRDQKFGGEIINYHYKIQNNYDVITKLNKINYIFSNSGLKKISLSVQDNDSVWSDEITKNIIIN